MMSMTHDNANDTTNVDADVTKQVYDKVTIVNIVSSQHQIVMTLHKPLLTTSIYGTCFSQEN